MTIVAPELLPGQPEPGSARWWIARLESELQHRRPEMDEYRDLVDDVHPFPVSQETALKFQRMAELATTNLCGLAVEATAERMVVEGVRIGDDPDADKGVWDILQRCDFDACSQDAITAALTYKRSFLSLEPPTEDHPGRLHYEDPRHVVVAYSPDGSPRAALKVFTDEWTGDTLGTFYTPGVVARMVRQGNYTVAGPSWMLRPMPRGEDSITANPLGEIPFFELQNKLTGALRSEVAPLVIPQRLLNQTMYNIEAISEYGAFRQKYATGIEVPRDVEGNPIAPFEAHIAKLFIAEGADAKFGDFNATDLGPHLEFAREIAAHMARISRIPITYFINNVSNLSAEALALMISGLVHKCRRRVTGYEPGIEGAVRALLRASGDARANVANIDVHWARMETTSVAQDADAAVKLTQGDNPVITPQTAQERYLGMSQTERDRDEAFRREGQATSNLAAVLEAATAAPLA